LGLLLSLKVPLGSLCLSASCKVDSSHAGHFLFLGTTTGSTGSSGWSGSSLGCSGEHVLSSLGSSYSSSSLDSMGSSIDFLKEIFSSKVTSLLISIFCC
jgi:hypothetical protein